MTLSKFDLNTKSALITGASGLLGIEHAHALLELGAKVVLTDISEKGLEIAKEKLIKFYKEEDIVLKKMDVSKKSDIQKVYEDLSNENIRIDILINNAAIDPKVRKGKELDESTRFENFDIEQWNLELNVGLAGAFLCSQIFGSKMAEDHKGGVILNIASDLSVISPDQRLYKQDGVAENMQKVKPVTYSVIKTGLIGLTRYLSTYWANSGVRCNSLSPGGVFNDQDDQFIKRITELIPLNRMANSDEYRGTVQYLCSDASSYMNGQNIVVDGGRSIW
jgi:NAD(P)-dependent dehydrogenase (short-subunit alcohol dehydrogenase family)|tara:strand:- start:1533 stop:2366 length:834 start_codon:yes stop_codon:yes gene_type:complete